MSDLIEVRLPQWGMGMEEGTIAEWLKSVGDNVEEDEALALVEVEKTEGELLAPVSGILVEVLAAVGDTVLVQGLVARIQPAS